MDNNNPPAYNPDFVKEDYAVDSDWAEQPSPNACRQSNSNTRSVNKSAVGGAAAAAMAGLL